MLPLQQFRNFIQQHNLFSPKQKILLAVSGGKDSVLMAHFFKNAEMDFAIAHCNFQLRETESTRDENFVKDLASNLEVPFYSISFETKKYAKEKGISTQMAARDLRYNWFEEIRLKHNFDFIALAQHQNDAVETVLINLVRGTGISGLHGILPKRDYLIRPLLFLNAIEIAQIITSHKIDYVEDSSNVGIDYARNKIRHLVIPTLQEINPSLEQTFTENSKRFADVELFLKQQVAQLNNRILKLRADNIHIKIEDIINLESAHLLFYEILKPYNFTETVVNDILLSANAQSGKVFFSATHQLLLNREEYILSPILIEADLTEQFIIGAGVVEWNNASINLSFTDNLTFNTNKNTAFVDADLLVFPLKIRCWSAGDKFMPLGMNQFKKLSDFFIDEKLATIDKKTLPLIVNGNNEIVWLAGARTDNRYKITKATKKVAIFELKIY